MNKELERISKIESRIDTIYNKMGDLIDKQIELESKKTLTEKQEQTIKINDERIYDYGKQLKELELKLEPKFKKQKISKTRTVNEIREELGLKDLTYKKERQQINEIAKLYQLSQVNKLYEKRTLKYIKSVEEYNKLPNDKKIYGKIDPVNFFNENLSGDLLKLDRFTSLLETAKASKYEVEEIGNEKLFTATIDEAFKHNKENIEKRRSEIREVAYRELLAKTGKKSVAEKAMTAPEEDVINLLNRYAKQNRNPFLKIPKLPTDRNELLDRFKYYQDPLDLLISSQSMNPNNIKGQFFINYTRALYKSFGNTPYIIDPDTGETINAVDEIFKMLNDLPDSLSNILMMKAGNNFDEFYKEEDEEATMTRLLGIYDSVKSEYDSLKYNGDFTEDFQDELKTRGVTAGKRGLLIDDYNILKKNENKFNLK